MKMKCQYSILLTYIDIHTEICTVNYYKVCKRKNFIVFIHCLLCLTCSYVNSLLLCNPSPAGAFSCVFLTQSVVTLTLQGWFTQENHSQQNMLDISRQQTVKVELLKINHCKNKQYYELNLFLSNNTNCTYPTLQPHDERIYYYYYLFLNKD